MSLVRILAKEDGKEMSASPFKKGWSLSCPRCGNGRLYDGLLSIAEGCQSCGLNYDFADSGDGPAVFVILLLGGVVAGLALISYFVWNWPVWVMAIIWPVMTIWVAIVSLRKGKAILIAQQYAQDASEGRLD